MSERYRRKKQGPEDVTGKGISHKVMQIDRIYNVNFTVTGIDRFIPDVVNSGLYAISSI